MSLRATFKLVEAAANTAKQEAQAMGFDTSRIWYHGTTGKQIDSFDPTKLGSNTGAKSATKGFFFASDPDVAASYGKHETYMPDVSKPYYDQYVERLKVIDPQLKEIIDQAWGSRGEEEYELKQRFYHAPKKKQISADEYQQGMHAINAKYDTEENRALQQEYQTLSKEKTELERRVKGMPKMAAISRAVVHPVYLKMTNPLIFDMKGNHYREMSYNDILVKARRGRRDGVIIKNTYDPGYSGANVSMCDIAVVFNPQQIRSIFASPQEKNPDAA
jgi:hypothetical protein